MNKETEKRITDLIEYGTLEKRYIDKDHQWTSELTPQFTFSYSSETYAENGHNVTYPIYEITYTINGDYIGSTLQRANYKHLKESYPSIITIIHLDFSTSAICLNPEKAISNNQQSDLDDCLCELESLTSYPVLDDELLSEIETELETSYIEEEIIPDLKQHIEAQYGIPTNLLSTRFLYNMVRTVMKTKDEYAIFETGCNCYIDTDKLNLKEQLEEEVIELKTNKSAYNYNIVQSIVIGLKNCTSPDKREQFFSIMKEIESLYPMFLQYESESDYLITN